MTTDEIKAMVEIYATAAPVRFEAMVNAAKAEGMTDGDLDELGRALQNHGAMLVAIGAYIGERSGYGCGDQGHKKGVKEFNKVHAKCRKAAGFNATPSVTF